jgi:hypothetical protein
VSEPTLTPEIWDCPDCGFGMLAVHHDLNRDDNCPCCSELKLRADLARVTAERDEERERRAETVAMVQQLTGERDKLARGLAEIRRGKTQADNEHPMGEYFSMAMRFHGIASQALDTGRTT